MILDKRVEFAAALALNLGAPATFNLGDVIDLTTARDIGNGEAIWWYAKVIAAVTSAGAATVALELVTDDNAGMATPTVLISTGVFAVASLTAGALLAMVAVPLIRVPERYLGIRQVTGAFALTAGSITSGLTLDPKKWLALPDGVN